MNGKYKTVAQLSWLFLKHLLSINSFVLNIARLFAVNKTHITSIYSIDALSKGKTPLPPPKTNLFLILGRYYKYF